MSGSYGGFGPGHPMYGMAAQGPMPTPATLDPSNPVAAKQQAAMIAAQKLTDERNIKRAEDAKRSSEGAEAQPGKKRRKKRWGDSTDRAQGVVAVIPKSMTEDQQQAYILHVRIQELTQLINTPGHGIDYTDPRGRSPSPEPVYSNDGKRLNTREVRTKKKLELERHDLIEKVIKLDKDYKPPRGYVKPDIKIQDRVPIPQDEHPHIGFMGLLIGPRGNTLKKIQQETRCKVMIRGKGTEKQGKGRDNRGPQPGDGEPMHAIVEAPTAEWLKKGVDRIRQIIKVGIDCPDGQNELKRMQLRELAALNGTLREEELMMRCKNCGSYEHKTYQCKEAKNFVNDLVCTRCGGKGHLAADCTVDLENLPAEPVKTQESMDSEYMALMNELGEGKGAAPPPPGTGPPGTGAPPPPGTTPAPPGTTPGPPGTSQASRSAPPPWEKSSTSAPPWQQQQQQRSAPPPQNYGGYGYPPQGGYGAPQYGAPPYGGGYGAPPPWGQPPGGQPPGTGQQPPPPTDGAPPPRSY